MKIEPCIVCGRKHSESVRFTPTKAGYLWLATNRAKKNAERLKA